MRARENSYYDTEDEDKLIDYMIAFEALFTVGERGKKGEKIASECANLLGKSIDEKQEIRDALIFAYKKRNSIVHGEDFEIREENDLYLADLVVDIEEFLRKAIKQKIKKTSEIFNSFTSRS